MGMGQDHRCWQGFSLFTVWYVETTKDLVHFAPHLRVPFFQEGPMNRGHVGLRSALALPRVLFPTGSPARQMTW